jgi:hypothetical protein
MKYDLSESISQRSSGEKDAENHRIKEISNEIRRRCEVYETESRDGQNHVNHFEAEQRIAEQFAKDNDIWLSMDDAFNLGVPGPSGNENFTFISHDTIFKVNNLLNSGGISNLLNKITLHNTIFPETFYYLIGFAGYDNRSVMPVLKQDLIKNAVPATSIEIDTYMSAIGFTKNPNDGKFYNDSFIVWDVVPRNVLKDKEGDIFVIDAEIASIVH